MMKKVERCVIPAAGTASVLLSRGQRCRIVNTQGGQVVDTWVFNARDVDEYLSMEHSRSATYHLQFRPGDTLVSNRFRSIVTYIEDTSPGWHDTLHAACSAGSYQFYGVQAPHPNCQDNLLGQMSFHGHTLSHIPCPWNLFETTVIDENLSLSDRPAAAAAGDYVELQAEMAVMVVCSACPSRIGHISGEHPRAAAIDVLTVADRE